jgi:1-phosphatidylinositol-4-phosphate 5-kinase
MKEEEIKVMLKILPNYVEHLRRNPNSLIAKIFGIFTIEKDGFGKVHVMLMENTLQYHNKENVKYIFDLKGSKLSRETKGECTNMTIRKDLDYLRDKKKTPKLFEMAAIN